MKGKADSKQPAPEAQLRTFVDKLDPKNQKLFKSVRAALRKRFPTANELAYDYPSSLVVGYAPSDKGIQSVVAISARADGVQLFFNQGPKLPDPKKLLQGSAKQVRFIQLDSATRLAHPDVKALIAAAEDVADVALPSTGKGSLIIKSDGAKKKKAKAKAKKK